MGFNSVEMPIADVVARLADPVDRSLLAPILEAADLAVGGADGLTSELEARDYLERNPEIQMQPGVRRALDILGSVTPPAELSRTGRTFLQVRSELARITHDLAALESASISGPSPTQTVAIRKLEDELERNVRTARELATVPQFATIAGYANAAVIRIASFRAYGVFADDSFSTPPLIIPSVDATLACARIELAAVRDAAEHLSYTTYTVVKGPPDQVTQLADTLNGIRARLEQIQPQQEPISREVAALNGDFNATLRVAATTTYSVRTRKTTVTIANVSDAGLPEPLLPTR